MKFEYRNVCEVIVKNDLCIGCGLCAAICPVQVLRMEPGPLGEYQAVEFKEGCLPTCNLCLEVCPFWDRNPNEDQLAEPLYSQLPAVQRRPETGFFLESYAGYSNVSGQRALGASGGAATWFLQTLLEKQLVDRVICVGATSDSAQLFKFQVCSTPQEVQAASRSCYYPVELSAVVRFIMENEGRYAIIGVPCFIKGLRLAMQRFPKLGRRITFLVGFVCAQTQSKLFAEQMCRLKGGDPASMVKATFRVKDPARPANDYGFQFECSRGPVRQGRLFFKQGLGELWLNGYFTPTACHYCDDIFAETADITLMDAWLPEFQSDPRGHNLVLARSRAAADLIQEGMQTQALTLKPIGIDAVIRSQAGDITRKRKILALRIALKRQDPSVVYLPRKRVSSSAGLEIEERLLFHLRERLRGLYRSGRLHDPQFSAHAWQLSPFRLAIFLVTKFSFIFKAFRRIFKD